MFRQLRHAGFLLPGALTSALWLKGGYPALPGWSCPIRALTGVPCPTCFLTRSTAEALQGHLTSSLQLHAFGPAVAVGLLAWTAWSLWHQRLLPARWRPWQRRSGMALALALFGYWGVRQLLLPR